tara:strand:- start:2474 stop:2893 length:420 start_codon:yes stop_codon:yes gene_type:complete
MSFAKQVRRFQLKTQLSMDIIIRKLLFDAYQNLLSLSPVLTGRFRASWRMSVGQPDLSVEPERESAGPGSGKLQSASTGEVATAIAGVDTTQDQTYWFTNNLPYARPLENGSSQQNPLGIVSQAFTALVAEVEKIRRIG